MINNFLDYILNMSSRNKQKIDTKLKAYKLIHDPVVLLKLIYSKYGDLEEEIGVLYINQLLYDKPYHYNTLFKEFVCMHNGEEFLKRFYRKYESKPRIPKLYEYYKNYHLFFCRPKLSEAIISEIMEKNADDKAEIFYKNHYDKSKSKSKKTEKHHNSDSLSSLDNITDNNIIFTQKTKKIIDKNLDNNNCTLTLTTNSFNNNYNNINNEKEKNSIKNYNEGLISKRSVNGSFEKIVHNLIYYKKIKKIVRHKRNIINYQMKNNTNKKNQSKKKLINKIGINYGNKRINKNIFYSFNLSNTPINENKESILQNKRNQNSLFSLLKSKKKFLGYTRTEKNISNIINNNAKSLSIKITKSHKKNNKINNKIFCSPKNSIEKSHLLSNLEEFNTNKIRPNTSLNHKRNKIVFYYNQNQITGSIIPTISINNNYITNISNNITKNNNSRNYVDPEKNSNYKKIKLHNYFTNIHNNNNDKEIKKYKVLNEIKNRIKNNTFQDENVNNYLMKRQNMNENLKIYRKNKITRQSYNFENNNQILIKKNNLVGNSGSKFNLIKKPLKKNNNNNIFFSNIKSNIKYYNPKFSPINCFNKNIIINKKLEMHKKNQTCIQSNILDTSPNNYITSPAQTIKHLNKIYNVNQSENITSKIRPRIKKKIHNLNINFNNVIFNAPLTNINQNINISNHFINKTNGNFSYKLLTPTQKNFKVFSGNSNNNFSNLDKSREHQISNINYTSNIKDFSYFSRNKNYLSESSISQNDDNYSTIKTNNNKIRGKIAYYKNKNANHIGNIIFTDEKEDIFKNKKNEIIIPISISHFKNVSLKKCVKSLKNNKKSKKKIEGRNKKHEEAGKNYKKTETFKRIDINKSHEIVKTKEDNKNINISNKFHQSPNQSIKIFNSQPINVKRNTNLMSKKILKIKAKINPK